MRNLPVINSVTRPDTPDTASLSVCQHSTLVLVSVLTADPVSAGEHHIVSIIRGHWQPSYSYLPNIACKSKYVFK